MLLDLEKAHNNDYRIPGKFFPEAKKKKCFRRSGRVKLFFASPGRNHIDKYFHSSYVISSRKKEITQPVEGKSQTSDRASETRREKPLVSVFFLNVHATRQI